MGKVITVASGKGGTGKTTTVAAVSSCLAALGHKTLCIDCDIGLKNLDVALCMTDFAVSDLADVLDGTIPLMDACHENPEIPNLFFLPAPAFREPGEFSADAMSGLLETVRNEFEFCLIDAPSGIGSGLRLAASGADLTIIVTTDEPTSMRDAQRAAEIIRDMGVAELRMLINRFLPKKYKQLPTTVDDIIDTVGVQLLGIICEDDSVSLALNYGVPLVLFPDHSAAHGFLEIARRIRGEKIPMLGKR